MTSIKRLIKATFIYDMIKSSKAKRNLARWTPHDQEMFDFYRQFLSPGELCFDVGANVGNRVKVFLRLKARVIAIEPQLYCARVLRAVYGSDPQLTVVQKALGESEGEAEMMISEAGTISTL